ncbi:DUF397 domain-containing protein [Streptomyces sp. ADMS]|uniref:DUF397 domain-containing protein n=1 Tax=Streptomyces sp. ADMS TaxID=3071415 RepID=UPI003995AB84
MNRNTSIEGASSLAWFKSSYSSSEGDSCVEVALAWFKSSYSDGNDTASAASVPRILLVWWQGRQVG